MRHVVSRRFRRRRSTTVSASRTIDPRSKT
jgi:hypothetical protein